MERCSKRDNRKSNLCCSSGFYCNHNRKSGYLMALMKLQVTEKDKEVLIKALADLGKPLVKKPKPTTEEKKTLVAIENLIKQIAFQ